jgi:hypothetical protein
LMRLDEWIGWLGGEETPELDGEVQ